MKLSIVVPCFNEEEVLPETCRQLLSHLRKLVHTGKIAADSEVIFVDDGSRDKTWLSIEGLAADNPEVRGVKLSRNRGHQNALIAGLFSAEGDAAISVDADLQDDLAAIEKMVDAHAAGADIVYGVRHRRDTDSFFKRLSAEGYYVLLASLRVNIVFNHADYRLLSRRALEALKQFGESNLFLRGIIPQLGYPTSIVYYDRAARFAGESKYPLRKMLAFAWEGVTSFSAAPLRMITALGIAISLFSFAITLWAIGVRLFSGQAVPGWASTVVPIYLLGGVQLLCIGIIGEYLAKVYAETKRRPRYFIECMTAQRPNEPIPSSTTDAHRSTEAGTVQLQD
jgi:glycosyltransferase involved in cell wall biosynthesis